jgi:hypothetical protein
MPISYTFGDSGFLFVSYSLSESIQPYISYSNEDASGSFQSSSIHYRTESSTIFNSNPEFSISSLGNNDLSFAVIIPSQSVNSNEDLIPLYITSSSPDPFIGFGTSNPITNLDIRSTTSSSPANLILRTNEDNEIQIGEETGRIIFAIESSSLSFGNLTLSRSGSTAAIYSKVIGKDLNGVYGNLIFEVNDNNPISDPIEAMTIGYGMGAANDDVGVNISGSLSLRATFPYIDIRERTQNNQVAYLGTTTSPGSPFDQGELFLRDNNIIKVKFDSNGDSFINTGNNFSIGTTSSAELLTVEGNISSSGIIKSQNYFVVSRSSAFTDNEFLVADGTGGVISTDALAVNSDGDLGIGTPNPEVRLHMLGEAPQTTQILMEQFNDTADAPDIRTRRYRGTSASRADVQTGDYLFRLNVHGQDGGSSELYGSMRFDVDGTDQDAMVWGLQTRDTNGTVADRITIDSAGDFTVNGSLSATINGGSF